MSVNRGDKEENENAKGNSEDNGRDDDLKRLPAAHMVKRCS